MRSLSIALALAAVILQPSSISLAQTGTEAVIKNKQSKELTDTIKIGSGKKLEILSGATIEAKSGSTVTGFGGVSGFTINRAIVSNSSGDLTASSTSAAEIGYVAGVTAGIQSQLDGKQPLNARLTALAGLASSVGVVLDDGSGDFSVQPISTGGNGVADGGAMVAFGASGELAAAYFLASEGGTWVHKMRPDMFEVEKNDGTLLQILPPQSIGIGSTVQVYQPSTAGTILTSGSTLNAGNIASGTAVVGVGGTGRTSATAYAVICGGTTSTGAQQSVASVGTSGQVLTSNGAGSLPTFQTVPSSGITIGTTTTSGASANDILISNGSVVQKITPGTGVATTLGNAVNGPSGLLTYGLIGTSGTKLPLLDGANTWTTTQSIPRIVASGSQSAVAIGQAAGDGLYMGTAGSGFFAFAASSVTKLFVQNVSTRGFVLANDLPVSWVSSTSASAVAPDIGIIRSAAGVLKVYDPNTTTNRATLEVVGTSTGDKKTTITHDATNGRISTSSGTLVLGSSAGGMTIEPTTAPSSPASGWTIYVDSGDSNKLKAKASNGTVVTLGTP